MSKSRLLLVGGALLIVVGTVWSLQGAGLLGGSAMTDDRRWLVIGIATVALGILLAYRSTRSRP
ncbi:MAG: hypothetical protein DWG79_01395 [Chloroflexi bacterium]|nr:hypothetical protein [Chloroflexota bacterium]